MNGNVRRNTKTAFCLRIVYNNCFFVFLSSYRRHNAESVDIPSTDKIADVDLSKQGVGIDISSGRILHRTAVYSGRFCKRQHITGQSR